MNRNNPNSFYHVIIRSPERVRFLSVNINVAISVAIHI